MQDKEKLRYKICFLCFINTKKNHFHYNCKIFISKRYFNLLGSHHEFQSYNLKYVAIICYKKGSKLYAFKITQICFKKHHNMQ